MFNGWIGLYKQTSINYGNITSVYLGNWEYFTSPVCVCVWASEPRPPPTLNNRRMPVHAVHPVLVANQYCLQSNRKGVVVAMATETKNIFLHSEFLSISRYSVSGCFLYSPKTDKGVLRAGSKKKVPTSTWNEVGACNS